MKAAGALVFLFIFYFLFNYNFNTPLNEFNVSNGKISDITLSDGTYIKLDSGSKLKYPAEFSGGSREVFLNGEAFFEVQPDSSHPFIIHANEGLITVLGTKFNIRAWESRNEVEVAVVEGKVSLEREVTGDIKDEKITLTKGLSGSLTYDGKLTVPDSVNIINSLSWIIREKRFNNVNLIEVLSQVERWYNLNISLPDNSYANQQVTIFIENKPLDEILEVISLVINLKYEIKGSEIRFY